MRDGRVSQSLITKEAVCEILRRLLSREPCATDIGAPTFNPPVQVNTPEIPACADISRTVPRHSGSSPFLRRRPLPIGRC
jgi:hypothetical protein